MNYKWPVGIALVSLILGCAFSLWRPEAHPDRGETPGQSLARRRDPVAETRGPQAPNAQKRESLEVSMAEGSLSSFISDDDIAPTQRAATWRELKILADRGDTVAACKLTLRMSGCRDAEDIAERIAESNGRSDPNDPEVALLQSAIGDPLARCADIPSDLLPSEWRYLLKAALAGHLPSMFRFVMEPPIDQRRPLEYIDALAAYRQYAAHFIDQLIAKGAAEGLLAGLFVAGAHPVVGEKSPVPRDPARLVQLASALSVLRGRPAILESAIASVSQELSEDVISENVMIGRSMVPDFAFKIRATGIKVDTSDSTCEGAWEH